MFAPGYYEIDRIADGEEEENYAYMHVEQTGANIYHLNFYGFAGGSPPLPALKSGQSYRVRCVGNDNGWPGDDAKTARMNIDHWAMFSSSDCPTTSNAANAIQVSPGPATIVRDENLIGVGVTMGRSGSTFGAWGVSSDEAWPIDVAPGNSVEIHYASTGSLKELYCVCDNQLGSGWTPHMIFENYD